MLTVTEGASLIKDIVGRTDRYNFHSHTEFCDGHAPVAEITAAAYAEGFEVWGVSPHSPVFIDSPCNMRREDVGCYVDEVARLRDEYDGRMIVLPSMEIDYLGRDHGPHIDYYQRIPLDYRIGSVHFVPNQEGVLLDCDGSFSRFSSYLHDGFADDLRYVVEKYFEQVLTMLELGGFDMLGHFDKIIGNASQADSTLEEQGWYEALIRDVVRLAAESGAVVEINTKAIKSRGRFYPAERWWALLVEAGVTMAVNSDCHDPALTDFGRRRALDILAR